VAVSQRVVRAAHEAVDPTTIVVGDGIGGIEADRLVVILDSALVDTLVIVGQASVVVGYGQVFDR
ncbi:MAG: hypothetical protein V3R83_09235, partial [Gammaproteobacteria bacterium]